MQPHVLVVGDIVTDVVAVLDTPIAHASDTPAAIVVSGGGAGANTACWLAGTGTAVTLCGVIGDDETGTTRLAELRTAGVTTAVRRAAGTPTGSIVVLAERTERTMLTDRGANLLLSADDVTDAMATGVTHLHLSGYPLLDERSRYAARHALALAAERGLTISVDAASADPLRRIGGPAFLTWVRPADVLFANADEATALLAGSPGSGAAALVAALRPGATAVVKHGASGAESAGAWGAYAVGAAATTVADTTGAGDAFAAGYLGAWLAGDHGRGALIAATTLAARAVSRVGARPPT